MKDPSPALSVVIPVRNERESISRVVEEVRQRYPSFDLILVDDGSTDGTEELLTRFASQGVAVLRHLESKGYGAALKAGIRHANGDLILTMDADGQHLASEIPHLLDRISKNDMVVGVRRGFGHSPLWRRPGKWVLTHLVSYLARRPIPDINSGFRIFRREAILPYLPILADGFSFSITSLLAMLHGRHSVDFVPIEVQKRSPTGKSRVTVATGLDSIILVFRIIALFDPLRLFLPLSGFLVLLGIGWGSIYVLMGQGISVGALLFLLTGLLLFFFGLLMDQVAGLRKSLLYLGSQRTGDRGELK